MRRDVRQDTDANMHAQDTQQQQRRHANTEGPTYAKRRRVADGLEAVEEGAKLLRHGGVEQPLHVELDVLLAVGVGHRDGLAAGLERVVLGLAEHFVRHLEGVPDVLLHVARIVEQLNETIVQTLRA